MIDKIKIYDKLDRDFFNRETIEVAKDLLGKVINFNNHRVIITETEAYVGDGTDFACHATRGKTKRTEVMFGPAGFSYVYFIYGMYHCLNFVTQAEGSPAAVLIRGGLLIDNKEIDLYGPGKLCRHLKINLTHNKIDIIHSSELYVLDSSIKPQFDITPRIGISKATDKLWRFVVPKGTLF